MEGHGGNYWHKNKLLINLQKSEMSFDRFMVNDTFENAANYIKIWDEPNEFTKKILKLRSVC